MKRKRKVLSLWATLILVFAALLAVAGITVLIVFLTRGNNSDVLPDNIEASFSGQGYSELVTENGDQHLKLYVSGDFDLTFSTTTEDVTKQKLTFSIGDRPATNGYIENDVIHLPKYKNIGEKVSVQLMKSHDAQTGTEVVNGGKCTIKVETENVTKRPFFIDVFVDVPVSSIKTGILNGDKIKETNQVSVGEEFSLATIFTPSASQSVYKQSNVVKEVFYEVPTAPSAPIEIDWARNKFIAKSTTAGTPYRVKTKTFSNAYYRKQAFEFARANGINLPANVDNATVKITKELNDVILEYFRNNPDAVCEPGADEQLNITVVDLEIEQNDFQINSNAEFAIKFDQNAILHTKSENGGLNLDISIKYGQNHEEQYNMYHNVGIKIPSDADWLTIRGGNIVEVAVFKDEAGKITSKKIKILTYEEYSSADYTPEESGENVKYYYYVLPDKSQPNPNDYFWTISAEEIDGTNNKSVELEVNLFYHNAEDKWDALLNIEKDENFEGVNPEENNPNERVVTLNVASAVENPPSWSTERVSLTIRYNKDGTINYKQAGQDLSLLLNEIPSRNVYRQVVYFMVSEDGEQIKDIDKYFNVKEGKLYTQNYMDVPLSISGLHGNGSYYLYEISGTTLEARASYTDRIYVVAAIIKTKADGTTPYIDDGKYKIVGISPSKLVEVTTMLSLSNMEPSFSIEGKENYFDEKTNAFKIPSIIREEGMQQDVIKFTLDIKNVESQTIQKIIAEKNSGNLRVEGPTIEVNGTILDYFTLSSLTEEPDGDNDDTTARMIAKLQVNAEAFNALHRRGGDEEVKLDFKLVYDDGDPEKTDADKQKVVEFKNEDDRADADVFVYYPKIIDNTKIESDYLTSGNLGTSISVVKKSNATEITWGTQQIGDEKTAVDELNKMLTYVLKDQYGRTIETESANAYRVELFECKANGSPADKIYISLKNSGQQILDFPFTDGEVTTYLCARVYDIVLGRYVTDASGNEIQTEKLTFKIESEGVSHVEYNSDETKFEKDGYTTFTPTEGDNLNVTIRKVISGNDTVWGRYLFLNNLIRVWVGKEYDAETDQGNWLNKEGSELQFIYSATNNYDLTQLTGDKGVMTFKSSLNTVLGEDVIESSSLVGADVQQIVLPYALNQTITLKFIATDKSGTFQISVNLVLVPDRSMTPNFESYAAEYSSYLVSENSGISSGVFGGDKIKLNDIVDVKDGNYSWSNIDVVFKTEDDDLSVEKDDAGDLYLKVGDVFTLTSEKITVYYGIESEYALQMVIRVLINPNFVIVQNESEPLVELSKLSETKFTSTFTVYRAVDGGHGYAELPDGEKANATQITGAKFNSLFSGKTLTFKSTSSTPYIKFVDAIEGSSFEDYYYILSQAMAGIKLDLNEKIQQSFEIWYKENKADYTFQAIIVKDGNIFKPEQDDLSGKTPKYNPFKFDIQMTYSADIGGLIQEESRDEKTGSLKIGSPTVVLYDGVQKMIVLTGSQYKGVGNVNIENAYGWLVKISNYVQSRDGVGILSLDGNIIKLNIEVQDKAGNILTVDIDVPVIISRIGSTFIKYKDAPKGEVNKFDDKDLKYLLGNDISDVFDTYKAGAVYKIVNDNGGFAYENSGWKTELKLLTEVGGVLQESESNKYATIIDETSILIFNLEQSFEDQVYLLVKFTISDSIHGSFSWLYRIKVEPSFIKGSVNYPFAEEGEYFDETSLYYQNGEYVVDMTEQFDENNSNRNDETAKTRFNDPTTIDGAAMDITEYYKIEADAQGFEYYFSSEKTESQDKTNKIGDATNKYLHIKLNNKDAQLTIKLVKYYKEKINKTDLVGGEIEYNMLFNQGEVYSAPQINRVEKDESRVAITQKQENNYYDKIVYDPNNAITSITYAVKIYEIKGDIQNPLTKEDLSIKMHEIDKDGNIITPMTVFDSNIELDYANEEFTLELTFASAFANNFTQDKYVQLSFYTTQKRAFVLVIHITHIYKEEAEKLFVKEIESGKKYAFNNWNTGINQAGGGNVTANTDGTIRAIFAFKPLANELSSYFEKNNVNIKIVNKTSRDEEKNAQYKEQYKYMYFETRQIGGQQFEYIDFSLLEEDKTFTLQAQFYVENALKFSYDFQLLVKASQAIKKESIGEIDLNKFLKEQESVADTVYKIYGGKTYNANTNALLQSLNIGLDMVPKQIENSASTLKVPYSVWTVEKKGGDAEGFGNSTNIVINPKFVDTDTQSSLVLTFELKFTGGTSDDPSTQATSTYKKSVVINFTISKSVELEANYAMPDGENESVREYIAATPRERDKVYQTAVFTDFFNNPVTFAQKDKKTGNSLPRISIKDLYEDTNIARVWTIECTTINNATIIYDGKPIENIGTFEKDARSLKNMAFTLVDKTKNGVVEFKVTVNGVTIPYYITIVPDSIIKVTRNFKNSININDVGTDTEIIFAENLAKSEEQTIFAEDRLLKVTFNQSYLNRDLFLMFEKDSGEQKWIPVTVTSTEEMLIDAGVSLKDYNYKDAYTRTVVYDNGNYVSDRRGDTPLEGVLAKDIVKTQRIELNYADGKAIKHDTLTICLNGTDTENDNKDRVILVEDDFRKTTSYTINVAIGEETTIKADSDYKIYLTADFQVINNADNANSYTVLEIKANPEDKTKTLLNTYNGYDETLGVVKGFGISKLNGTNYDQETMKRENKVFRLKIYGIDESLPLNKADELSTAALEIHNNLKNQSVADTQIKYQTGIRPYGGKGNVNASGIFTQDGYDNLIALSGVNQSETSDSDYYIIARGASNDGNHVMMRVSYIVTFGEQTVKAESNILFRVVPNSEVRIKQSNRGSENLASTEVIDGQTVQSNKTLPYQIDTSEHAIKFYGTINNGGSPDANYANLNNVISANMYGQRSTDTILKSFTYTMIMTDDANSWSAFKNTFVRLGTEGVSGEDVGKNASLWENIEKVTGELEKKNLKNNKTASANGLGLYVPELTLGEKILFIDLENEFGYRIRFYFSRTSTQNPTVVTESSDLTLIEGDDLIVGAQFTEVQPTKINNEIRYQPFKYTTYISDGRNEYNDEIKFTDLSTEYIASIRLQATLKKSQSEDLEIVNPSTLEDRPQKKTLNSGDVLEKTITPTKTISICGDKNNAEGWSVLVSGESLKIKNGLKQATFEDADIVVILETNGTKGTEIKSYSIEYQNGSRWTPVYTNYTAVTTHSAKEAVETSGGGSTSTLVPKVVTLGGVNAYAISNDQAILDSKSLTESGFTSNFNLLKVKAVDFYYNNMWVGGSKPDGTVKGNKNDNVTTTNTESDKENKVCSPLYTSNEYSFYTGTGTNPIIKGTSYSGRSSDKHFKVPYLNGIFYQYPNDLLTTVEMRITVINNDDFEAEIRQNIEIQRKATFNDLFKNFNEQTNNYKVVDGTAISNGDGAEGSRIYNDTLEIDMPAHSSVSFAVNKGYDAFTKMGDASVDENGVPFVTVPSRIDGGSAEIVPAKVISLSNDRDYEVTEYVSITNSMQDGVLEKNLESGEYFQVYVISDSTQEGENEDNNTEKVKFRYDNSILRADPMKDYIEVQKASSGALAQYTGEITLHIENEAEMAANGYKYKMVTLYFLYKAEGTAKYQYPDKDGNYGNESNDGNTYYQISQNFEVYPTYTSGEQTDKGSLKGYYKVADGDRKYYIVPISVWGQKLQLTSGVDGRTPTLAEAVTSGVRTHQFLFEISVGGGNGAGSAFIDDSGLITTNTNLDFSHIVTVNVYQKLSGFDGFFEEKTRRIPLGYVSFMLDSSEVLDGSTPTSGVYVTNNGVITIPNGFTLTGASLSGEQTSFTSNDKYFAYNLGQTMYFHDMFGDKLNITNEGSADTLQNITYHFVSYKLNDEKETHVYYNNLDSYTLSQPGTYTLNFVATGLNSSKEPTSYAFSTTVTIFNDTARTTKVVQVDKKVDEDGVNNTTYNLASLDTSITATSWYELNADGTSTKIDKTVDNKFNIKLATGIGERSFLAVLENGTSKIYDVTFFVTETETKSVDAYVALGGDFDLRNLYPNEEGETYQFYKVNENNGNIVSVEEIEFDSFKNFTTQQKIKDPVKYILVTTKQDGTSTATNYAINYYVTNRESTENMDMIVLAEDYKSSTDKENNDRTGVKTDDIKSKVAAWLGVGNISKIFLKNADGTLTELNGTYFDLEFGSARGIGDFLIVYTSNDKPAYRNVKINFYTYTSKFIEDGNKLKFYIDESSYIYASSLYSEIRAKVGAEPGSLVALYEYTEDEGNFNLNLSTVQRIVFGNNFTDSIFEKEYYVLAGGKYYLMTICITKLPISRDSIALNLAKNDLDFEALKTQILEQLPSDDDSIKVKNGVTIEKENFKLFKNTGEVYSEVTTTEIPEENNVTYYVIYEYKNKDDKTQYYVCDVHITFSKVIVHLNSGHGDLGSIGVQKQAIETYLKGYLDNENAEVKFWTNQKREVEIVQMTKPTLNDDEKADEEDDKTQLLNKFKEELGKNVLKIKDFNLETFTVYFYTDDMFETSIADLDLTEKTNPDEQINEVYVYVVNTSQKLKVVFGEDGYLSGLHFFASVGYDQYVFAYYQKEKESGVVKDVEYVKIETISGTGGIVSYKINFENKFRNLFNLSSDSTFEYFEDETFTALATLDNSTFSKTMFVRVSGQKYIINPADADIYKEGDASTIDLTKVQLKHKGGVEIEIGADLVVEELNYSEGLNYKNLKEMLDEKLLTEEENTEKSYLVFTNANFDKVLKENDSFNNAIYVRLKVKNQTSSFTYYKFNLKNI